MSARADGGVASPLLARLHRREQVRATLAHEHDPRAPELPDALRARCLSWQRRVRLLLEADRGRARFDVPA
jgi:hypothetical protein